MADLEQSAEQLFGEALELRPERRSAFLDHACQGAPELRRLVEELLRDNQLAGSFLVKPILTPDGATYPLLNRSLTATRALGRNSAATRLSSRWGPAEWAWCTERAMKSWSA